MSLFQPSRTFCDLFLTVRAAYSIGLSWHQHLALHLELQSHPQPKSHQTTLSYGGCLILSFTVVRLPMIRCLILFLHCNQHYEKSRKCGAQEHLSKGTWQCLSPSENGGNSSHQKLHCALTRVFIQNSVWSFSIFSSIYSLKNLENHPLELFWKWWQISFHCCPWLPDMYDSAGGGLQARPVIFRQQTCVSRCCSLVVIYFCKIPKLWPICICLFFKSTTSFFAV